MHWEIPVLLFILSIGTIIGAALWVSDYIYPNLDNENDCNNPAKWPESCRNCCAIWDDKVCRKGHVETTNGTRKCVSNGKIGPLILFIIGLVLFLVFILVLIYTKKRSL